MTLNELIAWCNERGVSGDLELAVHAFGGIGGAGQPIDKASLGFDWDKGKLMLHPKFPLTLQPPRKKAVQPPRPVTPPDGPITVKWLRTLGDVIRDDKRGFGVRLTAYMTVVTERRSELLKALQRKPETIVHVTLRSGSFSLNVSSREQLWQLVASVQHIAAYTEPPKQPLPQRAMLLPKMETKETGTTRRKRKS